MMSDNPYHEGELAVQQRANEALTAGKNARAISDCIPDGALRFIEQQPMVIVGSVGCDNDVWASCLFGTPGFFRAKDNRTLSLDVSQPRSAAEDPLWQNVKANAAVGLLIIEFLSRRRLRINGCMRPAPDSHYVIDVQAAYANCPKYIQRRHWVLPDSTAPGPDKPSQCGSELEPSQITWIEGADTFFVASVHPRHGADASHRGGMPGFVRALDSRTLLVPDYSGNNMFNTLGNFVCYPHAGLVFVDFERNRLLQLTGSPDILWDMADPREETGGTQRYWQFTVRAWRESSLPLQLKWEFLDYSRFIPIAKNSECDLGS
ncbi:MAG TPA: pyridoxamine 5'-phosphate oxidase family protein [Gammaproteobacteria bacterium]